MSEFPYAFIFDMDGVMVDNHYWHFKSWQEFCKRHGLKITEELFYTKLFGGNNRYTLINLFGKDLGDEEIQRLGEEKEAIYRELYAPHLQEVDGLIDFLHRASEEQIPMAVASSAPLANITFVLEKLRLDGVFRVLVHSGMITQSKPHPEIFLVACGRLGRTPGQCVVFEDSVPGFEAARAAGCRLVALATTLPETVIRDADLIARNFTGLDIMKVTSLLQSDLKSGIQGIL